MFRQMTVEIIPDRGGAEVVRQAWRRVRVALARDLGLRPGNGRSAASGGLRGEPDRGGGRSATATACASVGMGPGVLFVDISPGIGLTPWAAEAMARLLAGRDRGAVDQ